MRRGRRAHGKALAAIAAAALASTTLAACGSSDGRATLNWYVNPDGVNTLTKLAAQCSAGKPYKIQIQLLPSSATDQRTQLARRLAARDSSTDLMSLDPVFVAEFANAGWLAPLSGDAAANAVDDDVLTGAAETVKWDNKVVAFPQWANTQVVWYRKSLAQKAGLPSDTNTWTWDDIIKAAADNGGTVGVQGNKYEAYVVWINALIMGAGGNIVENTEAGTDAKVTIDSEAGKDAARIIQELAHSKAAQSDLSVSNEGTSLGQMYPTDDSAKAVASAPASEIRTVNKKKVVLLPGEFMLNWTFVYNQYSGSVGDQGGPPTKADLADLGWARYPRTVADQPSKPPIGGIDIGVGSYTKHKDYAMEAASCVTNSDAEVALAANEGLMPARESAYDSAELKKAYPADLLELFKTSVDQGGPRPKSAFYSKISSAVQSRWHPPNSVNPSKTPAESASFLKDVLEGKALL